jgi:hypothetical protein
MASTWDQLFGLKARIIMLLWITKAEGKHRHGLWKLKTGGKEEPQWEMACRGATGLTLPSLEI